MANPEPRPSVTETPKTVSVPDNPPGMVVRMHYDDHNPPHIHVEHQDDKVLLDFRGNILRGGLKSHTALRLIREWIDLHVAELEHDWSLVRAGQEIEKIEPLN